MALEETLLLDLFDSLYAENVEVSVELQAVAFLNRLVPCDHSSFNICVGREIRHSTWAPVPEFIPAPEQLEIIRTLGHTHPPLRFARQWLRQGIYRLSDLQGRDAFRRLQLYDALFRPLHIDTQAGLAVSLGGNSHIVLAANRGERDFSEKEMFVLRKVQPKVSRILKRALEHQTFSRFFMTQGMGSLVLLSPDWRIITCGEQAEECMKEFNVSVDHRGRLHPVLQEELRKSLHLQRADEVLVLRAIKDGYVYSASYARSVGGLHVLLWTRGRIPEPISRLTKRQLEVLRWISAGKQDQEISEILGGISVRTITTHVCQILERLRVENRSSAASEYRVALGGSYKELELPCATSRFLAAPSLRTCARGTMECLPWLATS